MGKFDCMCKDILKHFIFVIAWALHEILSYSYIFMAMKKIIFYKALTVVQG